MPIVLPIWSAPLIVAALILILIAGAPGSFPARADPLFIGNPP